MVEAFRHGTIDPGGRLTSAGRLLEQSLCAAHELVVDDPAKIR